MKRVLLLSILSVFIALPVLAEDNVKLPNIFIWSLPEQQEQAEENPTEEQTEETVNATTLKGYAEYVEDSDVVYLKDDDETFVLNIKKPQKISATQGLNLKKEEEKPLLRYKDAEYAIAPSSIKTSGKKGDFTFGALYGNEVDNIAMLEAETGLFTKYEKSKFALSSTYKKNLNTTYAQNYDTLSVAPEFKLNNYMSLKNVLSADITRNRRSTQVVFSVNPFGKKDIDRMRLEVGAKQTFYLDTDFTKTELNFSTNFKL